mmetsp:Transcript_19286/g.59360  ORF Transcript_19286/g.59360 Transcript_19286/m.59360 type:complete len:339 (-) Transcript_19286:1185-2201(-)
MSASGSNHRRNLVGTRLTVMSVETKENSWPHSVAMARLISCRSTNVRLMGIVSRFESFHTVSPATTKTSSCSVFRRDTSVGASRATDVVIVMGSMVSEFGGSASRPSTSTKRAWPRESGSCVSTDPPRPTSCTAMMTSSASGTTRPCESRGTGKSGSRLRPRRCGRGGGGIARTSDLTRLRASVGARVNCGKAARHGNRRRKSAVHGSVVLHAASSALHVAAAAATSGNTYSSESSSGSDILFSRARPLPARRSGRGVRRREGDLNTSDVCKSRCDFQENSMRVVASQVDRVGPRYVKLWLRSRILRVVGPKTQHSRVVWLVSLSLVSLSGFAGGRIK